MPTEPPRPNDPRAGVVFIDKARGVSSFAALGAVKRAFGTRKVGHTGTLDPFATGLIIALVGRATRCARYFSGLPKEYHVVIRFGAQTDTDDATGVEIRSAPLPSVERLEDALTGFRGTFELLPPAYSALHVGGRRAYEIARSGAQPDVKPRTVTVSRLQLVHTRLSDGDEQRVEAVALDIACTAGTYIRSVARELGAALGSAGHAESLMRTAIGPFALDAAVDQACVAPANLHDLGTVLSQLPTMRLIELPQDLVSAVSNGRPVGSDELSPGLSDFAAGDERLVLMRGAATIAIGRVQDGRVVYDVVLAEADGG
jgi:tRNA pseudouridine55 synthase